MVIETILPNLFLFCPVHFAERVFPTNSPGENLGEPNPEEEESPLFEGVKALADFGRPTGMALACQFFLGL